MTPPIKSVKDSGLPQLSDPEYLSKNFQPGAWSDRRQLNTRSSVVISGNYERNESVLGGIHSDNVHFYDLCLAQRAKDSHGQLVDDFRQPQPLGDVLFVPAGSRYVGGGGPGKQQNMFVFLRADALRDNDPELSEILARPGKETFMDLRCDHIRTLLTQICREVYNPGFAAEVMIEGLAMTLLVETARLLQEMQETSVNKGGLAPINLRRIRERVQEDSTPPALEDLAALCNLSKRHMMRAFRESTGQTVGQFIQQIQLDKARLWLRNTDKPVSEIAVELGFTSTSCFSTAFRRLTDESPRAYRTRSSAFESYLKSSPNSDH